MIFEGVGEAGHQVEFQLSLRFDCFVRFLSATLQITGNEKAAVVLSISLDSNMVYETALDSEPTRRLLGVIESALGTYGTDPSWSEGGLDGVQIRGSFQSAGRAVREFSVWSPRPGTPPHRLVSAALDCVPLAHADPAFEIALEELRETVEIGVPLRFVPGDPPRLRMIGCLSISMEQQLKSALAQLPASGDLIVDLSDLPSLAYTLLPDLKPLAQRAPPATWVIAHDWQLEWLEILAVDKKHVVKRTR